MFHRESHFTDFALSSHATGRKALPFVILLLVISSPVQANISHLLPKSRSQRRQPWLPTIRLICGFDAAFRCTLGEGSPQRVSNQPEIKISERVKSSGHRKTRSFTFNEHKTPSFFHGFDLVLKQWTHKDPADRPSIPAAHWNPFSRGIIHDLYPRR